MHARSILAATILALSFTPGLAAQVWDAPAFLPPGPRNDLGIYLADPHASDIGLLAIWRRAGSGITLGIRAGVFTFDDPVYVIGADVGQTLISAADDIPIDITATLGLGATFDGGTFARLPAGLSFGRTFQANNWIFALYVHPRIGLDIAVSDADSESQVSFTTDVGGDLYLSRDVMLRLGITVGDHHAVGLGIAATGGLLPRVALR